MPLPASLLHQVAINSPVTLATVPQLEFLSAAQLEAILLAKLGCL